LLTGNLNEPGGGGEPGDAGFIAYMSDVNIIWKNWSIQNEQRLTGEVAFAFKANDKYHISIWVQKQRVRLYANENKVLDVPRAILVGSKPNIFRFESDQVSIPLIGNFRITAGLADMRNRLLKDGKIISYGIQFDINSDKLKPESYSTLKVIADILKEDPSLKLQVVGHTDSVGYNASNLDLSKRRGVSVKNELVSKFGVDAGRLETDGKGETEPIAENNSSVNKAKNRRVEFINIKNTPAPINTSTGSDNQASGSLTKKVTEDENLMLDKFYLSKFVVDRKKIVSEDLGKVFSGIFQEVKAGFSYGDMSSYCTDKLVNIKEGKVIFIDRKGTNLFLFIRDDFFLTSEADAQTFNNALDELLDPISGWMKSEILKKENKWYFIRDEYSESKGGIVVTLDQKSKITSIDYDDSIIKTN
jgi:outer membrane protein OmpA-like peptidoglycan-associated protein